VVGLIGGGAVSYISERVMEKKRPRIAIEVTPEQRVKLEKYLKWGDLSPFFRFLIDDLLTLMEDPEIARRVMTAYITRKINLSDITSLVPEKKD